MINERWISEHNDGDKPGVLGVISLGGYPGNYTLRAGITGTIIAKGSFADITAALASVMKDAPTA